MNLKNVYLASPKQAEYILEEKKQNEAKLLRNKR